MGLSAGALSADREPERVALLPRQRAYCKSNRGRSGSLEALYRAEQIAVQPSLACAKVLETLATFLFLSGRDIDKGHEYAEEATALTEKYDSERGALTVAISTAMLTNRRGEREAGRATLEQIYQRAQMALAAGDLASAFEAAAIVQQAFSTPELKVQELIPRIETPLALLLARRGAGGVRDSPERCEGAR